MSRRASATASKTRAIPGATRSDSSPASATTRTTRPVIARPIRRRMPKASSPARSPATPPAGATATTPAGATATRSYSTTATPTRIPVAIRRAIPKPPTPAGTPGTPTVTTTATTTATTARRRERQRAPGFSRAGAGAARAPSGCVLAADLDLVDVRHRLRALRAPLIARHRDPAVAAYLLRIFEALRRIDDGTYGRCVVCGGSIELRVLIDAPEATRCEICAVF